MLEKIKRKPDYHTVNLASMLSWIDSLSVDLRSEQRAAKSVAIHEYQSGALMALQAVKVWALENRK